MQPLPPDFNLARDVHAAAVDEDLVFLNIASDAYLCLPGGAEAAILSPDRRRMALSDPILANDLLGAGLIASGETDAGIGAPCPVAPTRSALRSRYPGPTWSDVTEGSRALLDLTRHYRGRSFATILASARSGANRPARTFTSRGDLSDTVERFHRWIPYAPVSAKCLLRSFLLLRFLHRHGHDASWVFGVRTWPFQAHCWLQVDDLVLDDQAERVVGYAPILAV